MLCPYGSAPTIHLDHGQRTPPLLRERGPGGEAGAACRAPTYRAPGIGIGGGGGAPPPRVALSWAATSRSPEPALSGVEGERGPGGEAGGSGDPPPRPSRGQGSKLPISP